MFLPDAQGRAAVIRHLGHCAPFPFFSPGATSHSQAYLTPRSKPRSTCHLPLGPAQFFSSLPPKMSDDEADLELLALLRQHLQGKLRVDDEPETGVLEGAEYVYDNAIDVALDMRSCKRAASAIYAQMQEKQYSPATWASHELHPKSRDETTVAFIFTMDLLNFSFWSEKSHAERFAIEYRGKRWTGYWGLVAALQRALDEGRLAPAPYVNGCYCQVAVSASFLF